MSHICFTVNESYKMVDCTAKQMEPVICYIFNLNFAGIGIAYSITKLCLALVDIYYFILMKMTLKCRWPISALQVSAIFVAVICFIAWWAAFPTAGPTIWQNYYGYGRVPMRVTQSVLALLTTLIATMAPPWKAVSGNNNDETTECCKKQNVAADNGMVI